MHVLFGLGPDESALEALDVAIGRAGEMGDDLTVAVFGDAADRDLLAERARGPLDTLDSPTDVRELSGDPGGRLVELAESEGFDRIVLPGGTRSPLGKIQFDDVTEFVLLNATTTVTLIR
jgi:nucleotide-binding universal stress UspA family protein